MRPANPQQTISLPMPGVIDPTMNVNALVAALEEKTKELAAAESKYQTSMRLADKERIDDLAALRQTYEFKIADILMEGNEKALNLLASQFTGFKSDVTMSIMDLQQKSWTTQGEAKKGGNIMDRLASLFALLMSLITVGYLIFRQ